MYAVVVLSLLSMMCNRIPSLTYLHLPPPSRCRQLPLSYKGTAINALHALLSTMSYVPLSIFKSVFASAPMAKRARLWVFRVSSLTINEEAWLCKALVEFGCAGSWAVKERIDVEGTTWYPTSHHRGLCYGFVASHNAVTVAYVRQFLSRADWAPACGGVNVGEVLYAVSQFGMRKSAGTIKRPRLPDQYRGAAEVFELCWSDGESKEVDGSKAQEPSL